jgi:sulfur-carrier protein adenylyltransferase/sulfurtransferase
MKRFRFASVPIDAAALAREVRDVTCGGYASFEGWVRNHNEGHRVTRLEYEAFEALAIKEGERIIDEACRKFGVENARCVHRVGSLDLTEIAVWVGVSAPHRDEAFRACRYIIDEVKHRVPIWKKEHYESGDSGWVNCERCAAVAHDASHARGHEHHGAHKHDHNHDSAHEHRHDHDHNHAHPHGDTHASYFSSPSAQTTGLKLTPDYSRQMLLKEVGAEGQARLRASSVLVVGAGGLGVPVLQYLAGAGVGRIGIVDHDRLEPSNLHRQTWYALADCGEPKAELAAARVRALNPDVSVAAHVARLAPDNAAALCADYDLLLDCSDNFATKFLLNDIAATTGTPALFASVYQFEGQLQWVRGDATGACLRCVWPEATRDGLVGNCAESGVLGPVPGVLGALQALEALKFLLKLDSRLRDELVIFDLQTLSASHLRTRRAPACVGGPCQRHSSSAAQPHTQDLEVSFESLEAARAAGYAIVDIREPDEIAVMALPIASALAVPSPRIVADRHQLQRETAYLLVCARGARSRAAAEVLQERGFRAVKSLRGGVQGLTALHA